MRSRLLRPALLASLVALALASNLEARTVDCFADQVVAFSVGFSPPEAGLRVSELPGIVLGPPGDSLPNTGSTSTVSLGHNGWILLAFTDNVIVDGPGPDFIVFENAFFKTSVPADPNQPYSVFAEPGKVAVSADGVTFVEYPYDPSALALVGQDATPSSALPLLRGLAGITPTFTGNYTLPDDPDLWDPNGSGGVSGAGGDAFDLATVGLTQARYILITDLGLATGFAGAAEGFDLDSVVALHSIPAPTAGPDTDGDGLPDVDETVWYGTDLALADTDGDGTPDGEEVARCRSPLTSSIAPSFVAQLDPIVSLVPGSTDSYVKWNFVSSTTTYDVVRGELAPTAGPLPSDVVCLEDNSFNLTTFDHPDAAVPTPGRVLFYLVRFRGQGSYGKSSTGQPRTFASGDCPP
ncbi:MAG TPA: hypothetical protein VGK94_11335 [Candidatus Polarisedimenticolia bacterium]|jgi:hypothetical protein